MMDYHLGGLDPWVYHLDSLLIHCLNTGLVFLLAIKLINLFRKSHEMETGKTKTDLTAAFLASLLFGIHPLHVEPVAWITDRIDLLCGFFFLLSLIFYLSYVSQVPSKKWKYLATLVMFCMALSAKSMAISLPFILFLFDRWPLKRLKLNWSRVIIEKIPFLLLALVFGVLTILARSQAGSVASLSLIPLGFRVMNALHSLIFYLEKTLLPYGLTSLYPVHLKRAFSIEYIFSAFVVLLISIVCYTRRKKQPYLIIVGLFYCLTLAPTLGFVHVGSQVAADRYYYLPSVAIFLLAGAVLAGLFQKRFWLFPLITSVLVISFGFVTLRQISTWRNSITLWENVLKNDPRNSASAFTCLGDAYREAGRWDEALMEFNIAIAIGPPMTYPHNGKGKILLDKGLKEDALKEFTTVLEIDPQEGWAHSHLDVIYSQEGKTNLALTERAAAMASNHDDSWSHFENGKVYKEYGMYEPAISQIQAALLLNQNFQEADDCLGMIYKRQAEFEKSIAAFKRALSLDPSNTHYAENLASTYLAAKKYKEALVLYQKLSNL